MEINRINWTFFWDIMLGFLIGIMIGDRAIFGGPIFEDILGIEVQHYRRDFDWNGALSWGLADFVIGYSILRILNKTLKSQDQKSKSLYFVGWGAAGILPFVVRYLFPDVSGFISNAFDAIPASLATWYLIHQSFNNKMMWKRFFILTLIGHVICQKVFLENIGGHLVLYVGNFSFAILFTLGLLLVISSGSEDSIVDNNIDSEKNN